MNPIRLPDVPIYDELPEGWADISHIVSAPSGYHWINNRKSIFSDEYRHALLIIRNYDNKGTKED
jgi:hypothetical protein